MTASKQLLSAAATQLELLLLAAAPSTSTTASSSDGLSRTKSRFSEQNTNSFTTSGSNTDHVQKILYHVKNATICILLYNISDY